jgi:hypothetical protein
MPSNDYDYKWIIEETVRARFMGDGYEIEELARDKAGGFRSARLTWDENGRMLINNCFVDFGEDYQAFLSLCDEIFVGGFRKGWIISRPYDG